MSDTDEDRARDIEEQIIRAAWRDLGAGRVLELDLERGLFWVRDRETGAEWVVQHGPEGYSFEPVTENAASKRVWHGGIWITREAADRISRDGP